MQDVMDRLYCIVRDRQANSDIYFPLHIVPIAQQCRTYAERFEADPIIAEAGATLHDIGYVKVDHMDEDAFGNEIEEHIERGIRIAPDIIVEAGFPNEYSDPIVDCIRTHDGNTSILSPRENILVNDIDLFVFFQYPQMPYRMGVEVFGWNSIKTIDKMMEIADKKFEKIDTQFFLDMATPLYEDYENSLVNVRRLYEHG